MPKGKSLRDLLDVVLHFLVYVNAFDVFQIQIALCL